VTWFILDRVGVGVSELASVDRSLWLPDPLLAGLASLLLLGAYVFSAVLWGLVVRDLGGPPLPARVAVPTFMIANLGRYLPGKVWPIAGLAALVKGRGVAPATAAAAGVLGQAVALVAAAGIGLGTLLGGPEPFRSWGVGGAVLVPSLVALALLPAVFDRVSAGWFRLTRTERPSGFGQAKALRWLALYAANWMLYALAFGVLARSLGLAGGLVPVASAFAAAYVLGYAVIFAPAGLGPREGFLIAFLTPHVGAAPAAVTAVVARLWTTLVELAPATVFWVLHLARRSAGSQPEEFGARREHSETGSLSDQALPPAPAGVQEARLSRILVIVPTYNERDNIGRKVPRILAQDARIDVLVVDDASPDGTGEIAAGIAAAEPRVHLLGRKSKEGLGAAYRAGFAWGLEREYDLLVQMDADVSHPPEALPTMIEAASGHDVVVGSRYVGGRITVANWPLSRLVISYLGCWYARTITRMPVRDATGGFNCWRRKVLEAVGLTRIRSNGYAFQIELKFRAWRKGFRIVEVPILFTERDSGESKMSKRIVREAIWRVWWLKILDLSGRLG
jgi:dolichol-phosphate mannosyltransferase